jgi:DNA replication protein DnaC
MPQTGESGEEEAPMLRVASDAFSEDEHGRVRVKLPTAMEALPHRWARMMERAGIEDNFAPPGEYSAVQRTFFDRLKEHRGHALLAGTSGGGKTMVAVAALKHHLKAGRRIRIERFPRFKEALEPRALDRDGKLESEVLAEYAAYDVVLLDDLGSGNINRTEASHHETRAVLDLIDGLNAKGGSLWVTTNLSAKDVRLVYGAPFFSRLCARDKGLTADFSKSRNYRVV